MSARSILVRLDAEVSRYVAGMGQAGSATDDLATRVANTRRTVDENGANMEKIGNIGLAVGAATVAGLGMTAKAAMDWETAWTGVMKTVDGSPQQMNALEGSLRGLAKTLPGSHEGIAAVAEAAGQLGVKRDDIVGFTKTMIDLGVSTNLTADEAATGIAQISNVMGTMARDGAEGVSRFGAALVALGNDGASTEADILSMAQRIAGAAATIGASESDVLALSNTLASMGVKAELGGGVATRVMLKMYAAVKDGGDKLEAFAQTAGMSSEQFATAFGDSPMRALDAVNRGLFDVNASGGNVVETMRDMGIKGTEEMQVMLALANSGDLLTNSLDLGATAWQENTALLEEAGKRYATTESKIKVAWNNISDAAIDAGAVLLPMIQSVAEVVSDLSSAFGDLPPGMQGTLTVMAGVAAVVTLVGGALLTFIPKIAATRVALTSLRTSGSAIPGVFGKIGKAAGIAGAALIAFEIFNAVAYQKRIYTTEELAVALMKVSNAGKGVKELDNYFADMGTMLGKKIGDINNMGDAIARITKPESNDGINRWADQAFGWTGFAKSETTEIDNKLKDLGSTMAQMVDSGQADQAAKSFSVLAKEFQKNGSSIKDALEHMPAYKSALEKQASAAGVTLTEQELLNFAMGQTPPALKAATEGQDALTAAVDATGVSVDGLVQDMDKFLEQLFATGQLVMNSRDAHSAYAETLRGVDAVVKELAESGGKMGATLNKNKTDFDLTTEAGSKANSQFQDLARKGMAEVTALSKEGAGQDVLQSKLTGTYNDLIKVAGKFGITGTAAQNLARQVLGVPDKVDVKTWMSSSAKNMADATKASINAIPKNTEVQVTTRQVTINSTEHLANGRGGTGGMTKAAGGAIRGPGTGTSDDIPAMLSNGEHVLTAHEVSLMGGQDAVYRFRAALKSDEGVPRFSSGGTVGTGNRVSARQLLATAPSAGIDYARLAAALPAGGDTINFDVPDRVTAEEFFTVARRVSRRKNRGGQY